MVRRPSTLESSSAQPTADPPRLGGHGARIPDARVGDRQRRPGRARRVPGPGRPRIDTDGIPGSTDYCGGTLIGCRQFLTAASCATDASTRTCPRRTSSSELGNVDPRAGPPRTHAVDDDRTLTGVDTRLHRHATQRRRRADPCAPVDYDPIASSTPPRPTSGRRNARERSGLGRDLHGRHPSGEPAEGRRADRPRRTRTARGAHSMPTLDAVRRRPHPSGEGTTPATTTRAARCWSPTARLRARRDRVLAGAACATPRTRAFTQLGDGDAQRVGPRARPPRRTGTSSSTASRRRTCRSRSSRSSAHPEGDDHFTTFRWDLDGDGASATQVGKRITLTIDIARRGGRRARGVDAGRRHGDDLLTPSTSLEPPTTSPPAQAADRPDHDHHAAGHEPRGEPAAGHDPQRASGPKVRARALPDPHPLRPRPRRPGPR